MKSDAKILVGILGLTLIVLIFIILGASKVTPVSPAVVSRDGEATGSAQARLTLTEFSDFFCPACKTAEPYISQILDKHAGKIKFIYRHFPLPQHPLAFKAAQAAQAAALQGKFWEYKKEIFANQENLQESSFEAIAEHLQLELERFRHDLNSEETLKKVQQDLSDAKTLNLNSTPSFFINGEKINLTSFEDLVRKIESRL